MELLEIKAEVHRLIGELEARGAHVYIPRRNRDYAVKVGLRMLTLRRVVTEKDGFSRRCLGRGPDIKVLRELNPASVRMKGTFLAVPTSADCLLLGTSSSRRVPSGDLSGKFPRTWRAGIPAWASR